MATVINGNQIRKNDGTVVTAQTGGWYDGQQFWNGTLSAPGVINSQSNQQGAGQAVSNEVIAQTNPNNVAYIEQQRQQYNPQPAATPAPAARAVAPRTTTAGGAGGGSAIDPSALGAPPMIDLNAIVQSAYNSPDILAANKQMEELNSKVTAREQEKNKALMDINDNPFYAESTRTGKEARLNQIAGNDINTIANQQKMLQDRMALLRADAEIKVNAAKGQYDIQNTAWTQALNQFNTLLESGGLDNANGEDIANITRATGISSSIISSAIQARATKNLQTSIQSFDDGSDQGFIVYTIDPNGNIVNSQRQVVSPSTKRTGGYSSDPDVDAFLKSLMESDANAGLGISDNWSN